MSANLAPSPRTYPTLSHFSSKALTIVRPREQVQQAAYGPYGKPEGLWVSVDGKDDWRHWCESEKFHPECLERRHVIHLGEPERVLWLSGASELDRFTVEYGRAPEIPISGLAIDWKAVAAEYAGIVIAPYCWQRRLELNWYYPWDCASGCIWDPDVIERVEAA